MAAKERAAVTVRAMRTTHEKLPREMRHTRQSEIVGRYNGQNTCVSSLLTQAKRIPQVSNVSYIFYLVPYMLRSLRQEFSRDNKSNKKITTWKGLHIAYS